MAHLYQLLIILSIATGVVLTTLPPASLLREDYGVLFTHQSNIAPQQINWRHLFAIPLNYKTIVHGVAANCYEENDHRNYFVCKDHPMASLTKYLADKINNQVLTIDSLIPPFPPSNRTKRGLINFIGKAHKFLYGVATEDDIEAVDLALRTLESLANVTTDEVLTLSKDLISLSTLTEERFELVEKQNNFTKQLLEEFVYEFEKQSESAYEYLQLSIFATLFRSFQVDLLHSISAELAQDLTGFNTLLQGYLPLRFVNKTVLLNVLKRVTDNLLMRYPGFMLQEPNLLYYYSTQNIIFFTRDSKFLYIQLQIPIQLHSGQYQLYYASSLPLYLPNENMATEIELQKPYIAISEDKKFFVEMSQIEYQHCTQNSAIKVCSYLTKIQETHYYTCLSAIYFNNAEMVKKLCLLHLLKNPPPLTVLMHSPSRYLISTSPINTPKFWFHCPAKHTYSFQPNNTIFFLTVPCLCTFQTSENFISPPSVFNCSDLKSTAIITGKPNFAALLYQYNELKNLNESVLNASQLFTFNVSQRLQLYDAEFDDVLAEEKTVKLNYSAVVHKIRDNSLAFATKADKLLHDLHKEIQYKTSTLYYTFSTIAIFVSFVALLASFYLYYRVFCTPALMHFIRTATAMDATTTVANNYNVLEKLLASDIHQLSTLFILFFCVLLIVLLLYFLYRSFKRFYRIDVGKFPTRCQISLFFYSDKNLIKIPLKLVPFAARELAVKHTASSLVYKRPTKFGFNTIKCDLRSIVIHLKNAESNFNFRLPLYLRCPLQYLYTLTEIMENPVCFRIMATDNVSQLDLYTHIYQKTLPSKTQLNETTTIYREWPDPPEPLLFTDLNMPQATIRPLPTSATCPTLDNPTYLEPIPETPDGQKDIQFQTFKPSTIFHKPSLRVKFLNRSYKTKPKLSQIDLYPPLPPPGDFV